MAPAGMSISAGPASSTSTMSSVADAAGASAATPGEPFQPSAAVKVEGGTHCGDSAISTSLRSPPHCSAARRNESSSRPASCGTPRAISRSACAESGGRSGSGGASSMVDMTPSWSIAGAMTIVPRQPPAGQRPFGPWRTRPRASPRSGSLPGGAAPLLTGAPAACAGILFGRCSRFVRGRVPLPSRGALLLLWVLGVAFGAVPLLRILAVPVLQVLLGRRGVTARRDGFVAGHRPLDLTRSRLQLHTGDPLDAEDRDDPDQGDHDREDHGAEDPAPTGRLGACAASGPAPGLAGGELGRVLRAGSREIGRATCRDGVKSNISSESVST